MGTINDQAATAFRRANPMRDKPYGNAFDKLIAAVLLVCGAPLLALTALVVRVSLGRPLMFRQMRAGRGMTEFSIRKFRTMTDARDSRGALLPDSERQTFLSAFLRRARFDELPQLLAVWRGDMAFVGPRPLLLKTIIEFGEIGRLRCSVAPGMTGWAQVNGNTRLSNEQKLALDIWYIDHRSLGLDCRILVMTLMTLVLGERVNAANLQAAEQHFAKRAARPGGVPEAAP